MLPEIPIQLAGRVGSWRPRHVHDQARTVWSAWLRTAQQGSIGVYVLAKPGVRLAAALPNSAWVRVRGAIRSLRVQALGDDPRVADDLASTALLVHAYQVTRARRIAAQQLGHPRWSRAYRRRHLPGRQRRSAACRQGVCRLAGGSQRLRPIQLRRPILAG